MAAAEHFFQPWEPPPEYVVPPSDVALMQRITKLAQFAVRNGPQFVELMKQKQKDNVEYSFLYGGEGYAFYRWVLYATLYNIPYDQVPGQYDAGIQQQQAPQGYGHANEYQQSATTASSLQPAESTLPPEINSAFQQVLQALAGTKDSIRDAQHWFMNHINYVAGLADRMALYSEQCPDHDKQISVLYLANDVLYKSATLRVPGTTPDSDVVAIAFKRAVPRILASAYRTGGQTAEAKGMLVKVVNNWVSRGWFSPAMVSEVISEAGLGHDTPPPTQPAAVQQVPPTGTPPNATTSGPWPSMGTPYAAPPGAGYHPPPPAITPHAMPPMQPHYGMQQPMPMGMAPGPWAGGPQSGAPWQAQHFAGPPGQMPPAGHMGMMATPYGAPPMGMAAPQPGMWGYGGPGQMGPQMGHMGFGPGGPMGPGPMGPGVPPQAIPPQAGHHIAAGVSPQAPPPTSPPLPAFDPMSFPPGLIPKLVKDALEADPPYSPLSPLDIDKAGLPAPLEMDEYLEKRLSQFYAELQEYRAGMTRADFEAEEQRARGETAAKATPLRHAHFADTAPPPSNTGHNADGSFAGTGGGVATAGLGFGASADHASAGEDDAFESYRKVRSGVYHVTLSKAAAVTARGGR